MHGGNDKTVPVDQAENMIEKIKKHNKNLEFRIWNSADHSFTDIDDFKEMLEKSNQFFKNHTK
jgi:dipeptidyl aminopeptidase/acylaminoacyl peptidase